MHREQQEHQAHETALFKAWHCSSRLLAELSLQAITRWCSLPLLPAFSLANHWLSALLLGVEPGTRADTNTRAHRHCVGLGSCLQVNMGDAAALLCPIPWSPWFHFSTESGSHQAKTEEEKFSVQGAKQDCSTLAPFSGRRDQTQAFFSPAAFWLEGCSGDGSSCAGSQGAAGCSHAQPELRRVCRGRIQPLPCARQRRDSACELDFTRHQMCCGQMEIGSWSSFLMAQSSSWLLLPPQRVDGLIIRGSACSPSSHCAWDLISRLADNLHYCLLN